MTIVNVVMNIFGNIIIDKLIILEYKFFSHQPRNNFNWIFLYEYVYLLAVYRL